MKSFPPRIHALLASDARPGVVIRRGPIRSVCTLLWNRKTDEFRLGQWLRGRIYERRSDLSPDGKHLLYFAMNGRWSTETRGSWTAISRAPWLEAVALFAKGDCWNGGGLFTGKDTYWLNDGCGHTVLREAAEVRRDREFEPPGRYGGECPGVYYVRLQRDGWVLRSRANTGKWSSIDVFEKPLKGGWVLRKIAHAEVGAPPGKGCYWEEHALDLAGSGMCLEMPDWEWADLDRGRLVWASGGKLWAGHPRRGAVRDEECLHDFNAMTFEAIAAPY